MPTPNPTLPLTRTLGRSGLPSWDSSLPWLAEARALYLPYISPLCLPFISRISPLYLPYISPMSPQCLLYISPTLARRVARAERAPQAVASYRPPRYLVIPPTTR